jgi:hypothetical protein
MWRRPPPFADVASLLWPAAILLVFAPLAALL